VLCKCARAAIFSANVGQRKPSRTHCGSAAPERSAAVASQWWYTWYCASSNAYTKRPVPVNW